MLDFINQATFLLGCALGLTVLLASILVPVWAYWREPKWVAIRSRNDGRLANPLSRWKYIESHMDFLSVSPGPADKIIHIPGLMSRYWVVDLTTLMLTHDEQHRAQANAFKTLLAELLGAGQALIILEDTEELPIESLNFQGRLLNLVDKQIQWQGERLGRILTFGESQSIRKRLLIVYAR